MGPLKGGQIGHANYEVIRICKIENNGIVSKEIGNLNHNNGHEGLEAQQGGAEFEYRPEQPCPY
jgi:hypothetical protein